MADKSTETQLNHPQAKVLAQHVRDMSFENLVSQKKAVARGEPRVEARFNLGVGKLDHDDHFEVSIKLALTATNADKGDKLFLMEIDYVGVFDVASVPEKIRHPYLLIECPKILFPFLRRIVSDVTRDGGFQPLSLDMVNFADLYANEIKRLKEAEAAKAAPKN